MIGRVFILVVLTILMATQAVAGTIYFYQDDEGTFHFTDVPNHAAYRPFMIWREDFLANQEKIKALVKQYAKKHGVDDKLIWAVIEVESGFDIQAVSRAGAQGLMQIMPQTQKELGLSQPFHPDSNIEAGVRYLKHLLQEFQSIPLALAAYNAGPNAVKRYSGIPPYNETQNYVKKVIALYSRLKGTY